jgi:hypothetical protein
MPGSSQTVAADDARRATLVSYFAYQGADNDASHRLYHHDAILEFPQSGERFIGTAAFQEWRRQYPAPVRYRIRRIMGSGELWVVEILVSYDGGAPKLGVSTVLFRGDLIAHEIIYVTDPWDAAAWREPWVTPFDPLASIDPSEFRNGTSFGLEEELAVQLGAG